MKIADYSIGELARRTGVKVPTIRYYEQIGLIPPPPRTAGNQRRYDRHALDRLGFVAHARAMGFPMSSVKSMLDLSGHPEAPCEDIDALVGDRLSEIDDRLQRLSRLRDELAAMLHSHHHGTISECRILEVMHDHDNCATEH